MKNAWELGIRNNCSLGINDVWELGMNDVGELGMIIVNRRVPGPFLFLWRHNVTLFSISYS